MNWKRTSWTCTRGLWRNLGIFSLFFDPSSLSSISGFYYQLQYCVGCYISITSYQITCYWKEVSWMISASNGRDSSASLYRKYSLVSIKFRGPQLEFIEYNIEIVIFCAELTVKGFFSWILYLFKRLFTLFPLVFLWMSLCLSLCRSMSFYYG